MAEVMLVSNERNVSKSGQQGNVKTLSIIETLSELATDKTEASRLTLPSPIRLFSSSNPGVPPRHPKVSVPLGSPQNGPHYNGAKPRFLASSPAARKNHSAVDFTSPSKMNLSAIQQANGQQQQSCQRGQTPDWIRDIFHHAKRGNRDKLEMATRGLESTLIRNLTDHMGNNLLHCVCSAGHTSLLPFLTSRFANELPGALNDENRKGLTPVQAAIKLGRLECVQWLVRHSSLRDKLTSRDGERSLLHLAAKYGQAPLVSWLAEEMSQQGLDVDQVDIGANSSLHLAAKHGATMSAASLLHQGAQIALKNDMGLKPHDCAKVMGQKECAEYLLLYETSLEMAKELNDLHCKQEVLMAEHNELRSYFKDVLTIGKRLAREREEMCRELRRLHESTLELHDKMIREMQRRNQDNLGDDDILQTCHAWHDKWQLASRQWNMHNEAEHKLWIAEEAWRKSKNNNSSGPSSLSDHNYPQRNLRDRLENIKGRSLALPSTSGLAALASSDDEDEPVKEDEIMSNEYEDLENHKSHVQKRILANIAQRKKLATPAPSVQKEASRTSLDESLYSSVSNEVYSKIENLSSSSKNGTASVIEVIEPTASEEEEFKKAMKEMNWSRTESPVTIFPRQDELRSSIMTTTSASPVLSHHHARPVQVRSPSLKSVELSPTKKLMEMGISVSKARKRSPIMQTYANIDFEHEAEEHVLPDNFDDDVKVQTFKAEKSSISPSSRKSASSQVSRGSQDSGIGISNKNKNEGFARNDSKAWYDVPSEDEAEAPEADSLASIISHRGSSDDEVC